MPELTRKILKKLKGGVVELHPKMTPKGAVLLSYTTLPFISPRLIDGHTNRWECQRIAEIFLETGYAVDVIDFDHPSFVPTKPYRFCIDIQNRLETFSKTLPKHCIKLFHATTSHWLFNNYAEYRRLVELQSRRNISLVPQRTLPPSQNIEYADIVTLLGNAVTEKTYTYAQKPIHRLPISTTHLYPSPEKKDFAKARTRFIWLGGTGMVHKGLDLVLEAFMQLPQFELTIFGKADADFAHAFKKELTETPNIRFVGYVDPGSKAFHDAIDAAATLIFPSCSEGSSGGVVTAMHAGLIPVVSRETGVDVGDSGTILPDCHTETIKQTLQQVASSTPEELRVRALASWNKARSEHTREAFSIAFENVVRALL